MVETAVRVDKSQTLMVLSADLVACQTGGLLPRTNHTPTHPERASLPSGEICVLRTHDE